jgi:hypothetical protein
MRLVDLASQSNNGVESIKAVAMPSPGWSRPVLKSTGRLRLFLWRGHTVSGMSGCLLMPCQVMTDGAALQPVMQRQRACSGIAENCVHTFLLKDLQDNVCTDGFHDFNTPFALDHFPVQGREGISPRGPFEEANILSFYKSITGIEKQKSRIFCMQCGSFSKKKSRRSVQGPAALGSLCCFVKETEQQSPSVR